MSLSLLLFFEKTHLLLTKTRFKSKRKVRRYKRKRQQIKQKSLAYKHYAQIFTTLLNLPAVSSTYIQFYFKVKKISSTLYKTDIFSFLWLDINPLTFIKKPLVLDRYVS